MDWSIVKTPPTPQVLRQFAAGLTVLGTVWLGRVVWSGATGEVARGLSGAVLGLGLIGLVAPRVLRPVFQVWMLAVFPIGWLVSRTALALLFFLIFTPVAIVFRLSGRDILHKRRTATQSYWRPLPQVEDLKRYLQQF